MNEWALNFFRKKKDKKNTHFWKKKTSILEYLTTKPDVKIEEKLFSLVKFVILIFIGLLFLENYLFMYLFQQSNCTAGLTPINCSFLLRQQNIMTNFIVKLDDKSRVHMFWGFRVPSQPEFEQKSWMNGVWTFLWKKKTACFFFSTITEK